MSTEGDANEADAADVPADQSIIQTKRSADSSVPRKPVSQTEIGSVMGTLAYMPPEQAQGQIERLDERADVFGLGAIMCMILTGRPPYVGCDSNQVYRQAMQGRLDACSARLAQSDADAELIDIAKICLAQDPNQRFRDASALTAKITGYLQSVEQRLHQAELDRIETSTKLAEERKRRRVVMALGASILVTLCVAGGSWIWVQQQNSKLASARSKQQDNELKQAQQEAEDQTRLESRIKDALAVAVALHGQGDHAGPGDPLQLAKARESARSAEALLATGAVDSALSRRVDEVVANLDQAVKNQQLMTELDDALLWEMDQLSQQSRKNQQKAVLESTEERKSNEDVTDELRLAIVPEARELYVKALQAWGLNAGTTPVDESIRQIQSQPGWLQTQLAVYLQRMEKLHRTSGFSDLKEANWTVAKPSKLESSHAAKFIMQPDGSVFVTGKRVDNEIYTIQFPVEQAVAAIRLELIPDRRLPGGGFGRGFNGNIRIAEFEFACK